MFDNNFDKKLIINYNSEWILLSDWHERKELITTKEQLLNILHSDHHNFSDQEIIQMKEKMNIDLQYCIDKIISLELSFKTARSWGHGWQNVNKRETKVQLFFDIINSKYLDTYQKDKIIGYAHKKQLHNKDSLLELECQEERTQWRNKEIVIKKFIDFIKDALQEDIPRIETQIPQHENEKRLKHKKHHWKKKEHRKLNIDFD